jgi:hypothetical protein
MSAAVDQFTRAMEDQLRALVRVRETLNYLDGMSDILPQNTLNAARGRVVNQASAALTALQALTIPPLVSTVP